MSQDYNPKIYVMQLREIIYTAIFVILTIVLIMVMISMFSPKNESSETAATPSSAAYVYDYK